MSSVLKATTENKTFVTTHFQKLTTGNNVFSVSVIVQSHMMQFLIKCIMCPSCSGRTQAGDATDQRRDQSNATIV